MILPSLSCASARYPPKGPKESPVPFAPRLASPTEGLFSSAAASSVSMQRLGGSEEQKVTQGGQGACLKDPARRLSDPPPCSASALALPEAALESERDLLLHSSAQLCRALLSACASRWSSLSLARGSRARRLPSVCAYFDRGPQEPLLQASVFPPSRHGTMEEELGFFYPTARAATLLGG